MVHKDSSIPGQGSTIGKQGPRLRTQLRGGPQIPAKDHQVVAPLPYWRSHSAASIGQQQAQAGGRL